LHPVGSESEAGQVIERRLRDRGPLPYSLCEAHLDKAEFDWLTCWASQVAATRLSDALGYAGLVLLTFIAEWNRRNSEGDTVWRGLAGLFGNEGARARLFTAGGDAQNSTRALIEDTARRFRLRHAFDESRDEAQRWYITIQLQYGFCRQQVEENLAEWLRGHAVTEAMQRLLEPGGHYRSRSFQQLFADLRYFRRDYLTEVDLRRTLEGSPWVLPEWIDRIAVVASRRDDPGAPEAEEVLEVLSPPRVEWDTDRGPYAVCRVLGLDRLQPEASRYHLRHEGRLLASWFRQADGTYLADRKEVEFPLDNPEAVVRLEDGSGECVFVQTVAFWSASEEVQVLPLGRLVEPIRHLEAAKDYVLITREEYRVSDAEAEWCLLGQGHRRRRWMLVDGARPALQVCDEDGNLVWQAELAPVVPQWAEAMRIDWWPNQSYLPLGSEVSFELGPPSQVRVEYVSCAGRPLEFMDQSRTRTRPIRLYPELAGAGCPLRIGLSRNDCRTVVRHTVPVPTRGLAEHVDQSSQQNGYSWRECKPGRWLTVAQAVVSAFRVFTDGPNALLEGPVFHRRVGDRPRPLGRLLGTGGPIRLVDQPYNTQSEFRIASHAIDFGLVRYFDLDRFSPNRYRLELLRPILPTDRHEVVLWSRENGVARVNFWDVTVEQNGRVWLFPCPWATPPEGTLGDLSLQQLPEACSASWTDSPEGLLCGLAYEGHRLGFGWQGQWHRLFSVEPGDHPTLTVRQRIALVRWFRLPGMMANKYDGQRPLLRRLAEQYPVDLLAAALSDEGQESLPRGLVLHQDATASGRELFDVVTRELLFDLRLTGDQAEAIEGLFGGRPADSPVGAMITRLFSYHPLLAARALHAGWFRGVPNHRRPQARQEIRGWRLAFAGAAPTASDHQYRMRRDTLLEQARRTLSEATISIDTNFVQQGLVRPAVAATLNDKPYKGHDRANLLVALGSAAFRHFLGLQLLEAIENRL
jgi:hypothetical protein